MPLPFIVVEVSPPAATVELRETLVAACSHAAQNAECTDAAASTEGTPTAVALVTWKDETSVRIDVSLTLEGRSLTRDVGFDVRDPIPERWRTVGLLVGTLSNVMRQPESAGAPPSGGPAPQRESPAAPEPGSHPSVSPEADTPRPDSSRPPVSRAGFVTVGGTLGSALDDGPVRLGAELGLALLVTTGVHVTAGAGYAESAGLVDGVNTSFLDAFAGVEYGHPFGAGVTGIVHAEALAERLAATTTVPGAENPTSGERWRGGVRVGSDVYWWSGGHVGVFAGGYARFMSSATEVKSEGQSVGFAPALGYGLRAGLGYGF